MKSLLLTIALLAPASTSAAQTAPPQAVVADSAPDKADDARTSACSSLRCCSLRPVKATKKGSTARAF